MVIPPVVFYVVGAILVIFGALRFWQLGLRAGRSALDDETAERRRKDGRRHIFMGLLWIVFGVVLIASTIHAAYRGP